MSISYEKMLVTLDGSPFASQAIPYAEELASAVGAEILLMRVVPEHRSSGNVVAATESTAYFPNLLEAEETKAEREQLQIVQNAERSLTAAVTQLTERGIHSEMVVGVGKPAKAIVEMAEQEEADLIVMCTHGRSGLTHLVFGSVAEDVLHRAPCPVLLIRPESDD